MAVLDLGLPDGNGADLIAELRRASPGVGVLILSASLDSKNYEKSSYLSGSRRDTGQARQPRRDRRHDKGVLGVSERKQRCELEAG